MITNRHDIVARNGSLSVDGGAPPGTARSRLPGPTADGTASSAQGAKFVKKELTGFRLSGAEHADGREDFGKSIGSAGTTSTLLCPKLRTTAARIPPINPCSDLTHEAEKNPSDHIDDETLPPFGNMEQIVSDKSPDEAPSKDNDNEPPRG